MKLPSKTTPYQSSILAVFPVILTLLREQDLSVSELHKELPDIAFGDYISALDCLYALGKIELDAERGMLSYVDTDSV